MALGTFATIALKVINFMFARSARKEAAKKQMLDFITRFDANVMENVELRKEYEELIARANGTDRNPK